MALVRPDGTQVPAKRVVLDRDVMRQRLRARHERDRNRTRAATLSASRAFNFTAACDDEDGMAEADLSPSRPSCMSVSMSPAGSPQPDARPSYAYDCAVELLGEEISALTPEEVAGLLALEAEVHRELVEEEYAAAQAEPDPAELYAWHMQHAPPC